MHKITLSQFRLLYSVLKEDDPVIVLCIRSGNDFVDVWSGLFMDYPINRDTVKTIFRQHNGLDTMKWDYWTNAAGKLLTDI